MIYATRRMFLATLICVAFLSSPLSAQNAVVEDGDGGQNWLKVYFSSGSAKIGEDQSATLDLAVRTFREGDPFVMVVAGGADTVGPAAQNLRLSIDRASAVAVALNERGIPIGRLQVLGRGNSDLEVVTPDGVAEPENRVVEISWR